MLHGGLSVRQPFADKLINMGSYEATGLAYPGKNRSVKAVPCDKIPGGDPASGNPAGRWCGLEGTVSLQQRFFLCLLWYFHGVTACFCALRLLTKLVAVADRRHADGQARPAAAGQAGPDRSRHLGKDTVLSPSPSIQSVITSESQEFVGLFRWIRAKLVRVAA